MITDRRHAHQLRQRFHQAVDQLIDCWLKEHEDANAPSTGSTVPITGGDTSDPVGNLVLDDTRERHARYIGSRITGHLDAVQQDVARLSPRTVADVGMCQNCSAMPGVEDGLCPKCGRFARTHGRLPDARQVAKTWEADLDVRECRRRCGATIKIAENKYVCDDCQAEAAARRQQEYRDRKSA